MKYLYAYILAIMNLVACSESANISSSKDSYVTNAEFTVSEILEKNTSGIVFHMKPKIRASCNYMFVAISKHIKGDEWREVAIAHPGRDVKEKYGERFIKDIPIFFSLDSDGLHGLTTIGCHESQGQSRQVKDLVATFELQRGQLRYLGEIGPWDTSSRFHKFDIVDRSEFITEKLTQIFGSLPSIYQKSLMQYYTRKLSADTKEEITKLVDSFIAHKQRAQPCEQIITEHNDNAKAHKAWVEIYGRTNKDDLTSEVIMERNILIHKTTALRSMLHDCKKMLQNNTEVTEMESQIDKLQKKMNKETERLKKRSTQVNL